MLDKNHLLGKSGLCHEIACGVENCWNACLKKMLNQRAATDGGPSRGCWNRQTTLVRMMMLDWAQGTYQQKFTHVFYLNAREINQLRERSFVHCCQRTGPAQKVPLKGLCPSQVVSFYY